jgi:hypothetical protein
MWKMFGEFETGNMVDRFHSLLFVLSALLVVQFCLVSESKAAPKGNTFVIKTDRGPVTVKDFRANAKKLTGGYEITTKDCTIAYYEQDHGFLVGLNLFDNGVDRPLRNVQSACEKSLLQTLGISQAEACKLKISVTAPRASNPNHPELWGENIPLSSCRNNPQAGGSMPRPGQTKTASNTQATIGQDKAEARRGFLKRYGASDFVEIEKLAANPYIYEGKTIAVVIGFLQMMSRDTALFMTGFGHGLVASGVPGQKLTKGGQLTIVVGKVSGQKKVDIGMGAVDVPLIKAKDVYLCPDQDTCGGLF